MGVLCRFGCLLQAAPDARPCRARPHQAESTDLFCLGPRLGWGGLAIPAQGLQATPFRRHPVTAGLDPVKFAANP